MILIDKDSFFEPFFARISDLLPMTVPYFHAKKLMIKFFSKSSKNPFFSRFFGLTFVPKLFSENRGPSHSRVFNYASSCKKSEKFNEPITRKAGNEKSNESTKRTNMG